MNQNENITRQSFPAPGLRVRLGKVSTNDQYKPLIVFRFNPQDKNKDSNQPIFQIHLQTIGKLGKDEIWETTEPVSVEATEDILCLSLIHI